MVLTALAAALAFTPLTFSVFWSALAYVLIGGVVGGTLITLLFLPALCAVVLSRRSDTVAAIQQFASANSQPEGP